MSPSLPLQLEGYSLLQKTFLRASVVGDEKVGRCLVGTWTCAPGSNLESGQEPAAVLAPFLSPCNWPALLRSRNPRPAADWFQARAPGHSGSEAQ